MGLQALGTVRRIVKALRLSTVYPLKRWKKLDDGGTSAENATHTS